MNFISIETFSSLSFEPDHNYTLRIRVYDQPKNIYSRMLMVHGHQYLFGSKITKEEVIKSVKKHSLYSWLDLLSKLESIIILSPYRASQRKNIVEQVFPSSVFSRMQRKEDHEDDNEESILICRAQIIVLKKIALRFCDFQNQSDVYGFLKTAELSRVLLGVNDFVNEEDSGIGAEENPNFLKWMEYATRNHYLNNILETAHLVFRTVRMFKELPYLVGEFREEKNLEEYFYKITGTRVEEYISVGLAIHFHFLQKLDTLLTLGSLIEVNDYFKVSGLDKDIINKIINQSVRSYKDINSDLRDISEQLTSSEACAPGKFTKKPVIELPDGRLLIADQTSFILKHTLNLPWVLAEYLPQDASIINDITSYRGKLFEEYSHNLLDKIAELCHFSYKRVLPVKGEKVCDGILIKGNNLFLFETKSLQTTEIFKTHGFNVKKEAGDVNEGILDEAGEQLANSIKLIKEGRMEGIPNNQAYRFFPIVLTYEDIPTDFKVIRGYRDFLHDRKIIMETDDIEPLEIMSTEELELMYDHAPVVDLCDLYVRKHSTDPHALESSFKNFFFAVGVVPGMSNRLRDEFLALCKKYVNPILDLSK